MVHVYFHLCEVPAYSYNVDQHKGSGGLWCINFQLWTTKSKFH